MLITSGYPFRGRVNTHQHSTTFSLGLLNFCIMFCVFTEDTEATHAFSNKVVLSKLCKTL